MAAKKKFSVYGSCQAPALAKMLSSSPVFAGDWEIVEIEPCFVVSDEQIDRHHIDTLPVIDLFIYQPVSENYRGKKFSSAYLRNCMADSSVALSFQYMHWEGYHPGFNSPYGLPPHPEGYVDALVAGAVEKGVDFKSFISRIEELGASFFMDSSAISSWCETELRSRQSGENDGGRPIDIVMTDYIVKNWHASRLFYTMNHPTACVMREVAAECMRRLGYSDSDISFNPSLDPLDVSQLSLYPIYRDRFGFRESARMGEFQLIYKKKSSEQYFKEQFEWFLRFPKEDVGAFFSRVSEARPWIANALQRAFE